MASNKKQPAKQPKPWALRSSETHARHVSIAREVGDRTQFLSLSRNRDGDVRVSVSQTYNMGTVWPDSPEVPVELLREAVDLVSREDF